MSMTLGSVETLADLLVRLGNVPPDRILAQPPPGAAKPTDVLRLHDSFPKRLCELVDGVLVEKAMGHWESRIASWLIYTISTYLEGHPLGIVSGADGPHQLADDLVRYPDIAFIAWNHIPRDADPHTPLPEWAPSLAIEILSLGNTQGEMTRKLKDYFAAGVDLVWYVDPRKRIVEVYTDVEEVRTLTEADLLDGGDVLPGLRISVRELLDSGEIRRPEGS